MNKQNIGTINALVRITCGIVGVVLFANRLAKRSNRVLDWIGLKLSAMKVAEGIVKYCPVTDMVKQQLKEQGISILATDHPAASSPLSPQPSDNPPQ